MDSKITTINTALDLKAPINSPTFTGTVSGITAIMVGLGNVDNTSDADSRFHHQTALDLKWIKYPAKVTEEDYTTAEKSSWTASQRATANETDAHY